MNENARKLAQFRVALEAKGYVKCYFPCSKYRGLQRRRILITTTKRHFRERGHTEGGYQYRPFVRGYSIFNLFYVIVMMS